MSSLELYISKLTMKSKDAAAHFVSATSRRTLLRVISGDDLPEIIYIYKLHLHYMSDVSPSDRRQ